MYHCAPLMPFNPKDHHQVERRRFIGNDIVSFVVIFYRTLWNFVEFMLRCGALTTLFIPFVISMPLFYFHWNTQVVIVFKEHDDDEQFDLSSVGSRQNRKSTSFSLLEALRQCISHPFPCIHPQQYY